MPSAINYVPPTEGQLRNSFSPAVTAERVKRRKAYREALKYFLGEHDQQLTPQDGEPDDNVIINLVKMTADRTVSFLFPDMPRFEIDPATIEDTPEEIWLKDFYDTNGGLSKLTKMAQRGFLSGHVFVRIKPAEPFPRFIILDPTTITVYWKADDVADIIWYEMRYKVGNDIYIDDFVKISDKEWRIYTYKQEQSSNILEEITGTATWHGGTLDDLDFATTVFKRIKTSKWTFSLAPIIEWAHQPHPDDYYGLAEVNQKNLQDTINLIASIRNQVVRENAEPTDYVTGADVDDIDGSGPIITIPSPAAKVNRLEMKGDMSSISGVLDKLVETYLAIARVVLLKGEAKDLQRVTNASVRTLFLDALSKNSVLMDTYGRGLAQVSKLALQIAYSLNLVEVNPEDFKIEVKFGTPLPVDMSEIANINALGLSGKYMSRRTAATRSNLVWPFEVEAIRSETKEDMENQRANMELQKEFAAPEEENLTNKNSEI